MRNNAWISAHNNYVTTHHFMQKLFLNYDTFMFKKISPKFSNLYSDDTLYLLLYHHANLKTRMSWEVGKRMS